MYKVIDSRTGTTVKTCTDLTSATYHADRMGHDACGPIGQVLDSLGFIAYTPARDPRRQAQAAQAARQQAARGATR